MLLFCPHCNRKTYQGTHMGCYSCGRVKITVSGRKLVPWRKDTIIPVEKSTVTPLDSANANTYTGTIQQELETATVLD